MHKPLHACSLLCAALLSLTACQSDPVDSQGSASTSPAQDLSVEASETVAPALLGEVKSAELGAIAPDFVLPESSGAARRLSDHRGELVVLEWVNHGCPYVVKHYDKSNNMQSLQERYTAEGVVWLSICSSAEGKQGHMDSEGWARSIADRGSNQTAVLVDETGVVGKAYGARTTPHMFVIDAEGTLVYSGAIDSDSNRNPATIETADNYVAETLDELLAGNEVEPFSTQPYGCGVKYAD